MVTEDSDEVHTYDADPPSTSKPGKRGRVVEVKREASSTTHKEEKRVAVPEYKEPSLGDKSRHTNKPYTLTVSGVHREGAFEIFKSNGAWAMLFGKPLLKAFNAIHDYTEDTIRVLQNNGTDWTVLANQFTNVRGVISKLLVLANLTVDIKQLVVNPRSKPAVTTVAKISNSGMEEPDINTTTYKLLGDLRSPWREVPHTSLVFI